MDNISRKLCIIRNRDGFTLVELIVVLVIIGILLALAIPNLTGYIDKAQATSCRKNRAELEKIYRYDTLLAEAEGSSTTMSAVLKGENGKKLTCPSGGTYTYNETREHLMCSISKHNVGSVNTNPIANGVLGQFSEYYNVSGYSKSDPLDSGAGILNGSNTQKFNELMKKAGLNFDDMDIASWAYRPNANSGNALYWTSVNISNLTVNSDVPIMQYNEKSRDYSVRKMKVGEKKLTIDNTTKTYRILNTSSSTEVEPNADKKNYDTMYAIYQQALAEYNASQLQH